MIPYISLGKLNLLGLEVQPFFLLVAIGIVSGVLLYDRICRRGGRIDRRTAHHVPEICVLGGFIGAHLVHVLFYHPEQLAEDPFALFKFWGGISSIGGFLGGVGAGWLYLVWKRAPILPYADRALTGLAAGWFFGRMGCALSHDHPGRLSEFPLAVAYPDGSRFDLGLYEFILTAVILAVLWTLAGKPRRSGTFAAAIALLYAPLRFLLDFLRAEDVALADARYLGLTPAQYGMLALTALGLVVLYRSRRQPEDVAFRGPISPGPANGGAAGQP
ncbi:MAG: prolipoprotein diacylglyceryl transferase [Myxococcales bacterium]|nr:MAG: prolipoprotein diacylglyceryl transferase [Myxococcales bacterium]